MKKYYFGPVWEYIYYLIPIPFISFFLFVMVSAYDGSPSSIGGFTAISLLFIFWAVTALKRFSYCLVVQDSRIKERGIWSSNREVSINTIKVIERAKYEYFFGSGFSTASSSRCFYLKADPEIQGAGAFPSYAISSRKIISDLLDINPSIWIDPKMADLLPLNIRKKLSIKLTWLDVAGNFLGSFFVSLILLFFVIVVLMYLSSQIGFTI